MNAIFWKDLKDSRAMVYGLLCSIGLMCVLPDEFAEIWGGFLAFFLVPMFCAHAGANLLASELSDEQLPFLLTLPISRRQLWIAKVAAGVTSCVLVAGSALVLLIPHLMRPFLQPSEALMFAQVAFTAFAVAYALGTFFSVACDRPLTATFLAYMTGVLGWLFHLLLIDKTRMHRAESAVTAAFIYAWLWAILLLGSSGFIFTHSDLSDRRSCRRDCVVAAAVALLIALAVLGTYAWAVATYPELRKVWYR